MKAILSIFCLISIVGCGSVERVRVKSCKSLGSDLYECEVMPDKNLRVRKGEN